MNMNDYITVSSGYSITLNNTHCPELKELHHNVAYTQQLMTREYEKIFTQHKEFIHSLIKDNKSTGYFRDDLTRHVGKPYLEWEVAGNKSRLWRMLAYHVYQQASSQYKRMSMIRVIREGNHTQPSEDLWSDLRAEKITATWGEVKNIFQHLNNNKDALDRGTSPVELNYTTGDSNVKQDIVDGSVVCSLQCNRKEFFTITYQLPGHIDESTITKVSKPILVINDDGVLILRFTVFTKHQVSTGENILGVDLGKVKPFTAASITLDGYYSQELAPTRECDRVNGKITRLTLHKKNLQVKIKRLGRLLISPYEPDPTTITKYEILTRELRYTHTKMSRLKSHLSWLIARDAVNHAIDQGCNIVKVEDLSFTAGKSGKWNHHETQSHLEHKASKSGIVVSKVDAYGTSWEYPQEYEANPAPWSKLDGSTRELVNDSGDRVDKDYAAAIAIASRVKRKGRKRGVSSRVRAVQPRKCRDKHHATPKRPKIRRAAVVVPVKNFSHQVSVGASTVVAVEQAVVNGDNTTLGKCPPMSHYP